MKGGRKTGKEDGYAEVSPKASILRSKVNVGKE